MNPPGATAVAPPMWVGRGGSVLAAASSPRVGQGRVKSLALVVCGDTMAAVVAKFPQEGAAAAEPPAGAEASAMGNWLGRRRREPGHGQTYRLYGDPRRCRERPSITQCPQRTSRAMSMAVRRRQRQPRPREPESAPLRLQYLPSIAAERTGSAGRAGSGREGLPRPRASAHAEAGPCGSWQVLVSLWSAVKGLLERRCCPLGSGQC